LEKNEPERKKGGPEQSLDLRVKRKKKKEGRGEKLHDKFSFTANCNKESQTPSAPEGRGFLAGGGANDRWIKMS